MIRFRLFPLLAAAAGSLTLAAAPAGPVLARPQDPAPTSPAAPAMSEAERIARQYIEAYSAGDWDAMAPLMSEDFVLVDRTNPQIGDQEFRGREAVMGLLRDFGERARLVGLFLDFPMVFESRGVVVFAGHVNTLTLAPEDGFGLRWRSEQVTILTVRDGRVVRHEDFANYSTPVISRERLATTPGR